MSSEASVYSVLSVRGPLNYGSEHVSVAALVHQRAEETVFVLEQLGWGTELGLWTCVVSSDHIAPGAGTYDVPGVQDQLQSRRSVLSPAFCEHSQSGQHP